MTFCNSNIFRASTALSCGSNNNHHGVSGVKAFGSHSSGFGSGDFGGWGLSCGSTNNISHAPRSNHCSIKSDGKNGIASLDFGDHANGSCGNFVSSYDNHHNASHGSFGFGFGHGCGTGSGTTTGSNTGASLNGGMSSTVGGSSSATFTSGNDTWTDQNGTVETINMLGGADTIILNTDSSNFYSTVNANGSTSMYVGGQEVLQATNFERVEMNDLSLVRDANGNCVVETTSPASVVVADTSSTSIAADTSAFDIPSLLSGLGTLSISSIFDI